MAGSDTTVTALRSTLLFIMTSAKTYRKLRAELDQALEHRIHSGPVISNATCLNLVYLQACIKEALRLIPPAFAPLPKLVPPEGDMIHGLFVPGGTRVGTCIYSIVQDKSIFGDDAETFRPERWLEAHEGDLPRMTKAAEIMFGSGRYQCLGKAIAMIELRKTIATVRSGTSKITSD
ncbi:hypothetical protein MMC25_007848 [Agyrium rufum]|nr:hypothetical protein [Agyrium rufum]